MTKTIATILFLLSSQLTACFWVTTKHEGKKLRTDVNRIDAVVTKQEKSLGSSVEKLKSTLDQASTLLARNSANLGAQFDELEQENARLTGLVMEAKRYSDEVSSQVERYEKRLQDLESRVADLQGRTLAAPPASKSAEALWDEGMLAFKSNNYSDARNTFRQLVIKFPEDGRADDAQYYRGESYFVQKDYKSALKEYQALFEKFAKSSLADDAMYRAGESAEALKWCTDARAYFGLLRQRYPKSDMVKKAKKKDATLKKNAKNKKFCQS